MSRRCCCGKYEVPYDCVAHIVNDTQHDLLGPPGNFCGPKIDHEMRDLRKNLLDALRLIRRLDDRYRKALQDGKYFPDQIDEQLLDDVQEFLK